MPKKAIIEIELVQEAVQTSNSQIEKDIRAEKEIPWCAKISRIKIYDP